MTRIEDTFDRLVSRPRAEHYVYLLTTPIPHIVGAWRRVTTWRNR